MSALATVSPIQSIDTPSPTVDVSSTSASSAFMYPTSWLCSTTISRAMLDNVASSALGRYSNARLMAPEWCSVMSARKPTSTSLNVGSDGRAMIQPTTPAAKHSTTMSTIVLTQGRRHATGSCSASVGSPSGVPASGVLVVIRPLRDPHADDTGLVLEVTDRREARR